MSDLLTDEITKIRSAREAVEVLKEVYAEIPADTKKALREKWTLKLKGAIADQITKRTEYPVEQQTIDRRRMVRVEDVLTEMETMEEKMVDLLVKNPADLIWRRNRNLVDAIDAVLSYGDIIWALVKSAFSSLLNLSFTAEDVAQILAVGYAVITSIFVEIVETFSVRAIAGTFITMLNIRDDAEKRIRSHVLPQRQHVHRYRRRKRSRK